MYWFNKIAFVNNFLAKPWPVLYASKTRELAAKTWKPDAFLAALQSWGNIKIHTA